MNDDTNQRAREILSERSGAAYQFDWDIQVISLVAAEKAITSAREEALREAAEKLHRYYEALVQADLKIRSYPGADQSDVEFIRVAIGEMPSLITGVGERG